MYRCFRLGKFLSEISFGIGGGGGGGGGSNMCLLGVQAIIGIWLWWRIVAKGEGNVGWRNEDICGVENGRRLYLELGEKGMLYAKNVSLTKNEPRQEGSRMYASNSSHAQCSLELVTCPSCVIILTFESIALSHHCGDGGGVTMDSPCRCDYVWISEPPYEDVSGTPFCGLYAPITYRSSTRTLSIALLYSESHEHAFTLSYTAERNRLHLRGSELSVTGEAAKGLNNTGGGILTSPFFPARYPRDLGLEYVVTCPSDAPSCRIRLLFSDFQLAAVSIMEFYDWNGQRLDVSSGTRFRPPVIMSSGPSLLIRFYANGGTGLGYKAFYSFVIGHPLNASVQPITDCGGYVENLGGTITMMDMVGEGVKTYDCVWLIRPPKNFLHMKTHMYLKVITFADMAANTELIVKQGPTSALLPLEVVRHPATQLQPSRHREHVAPVTSGFHVSLRGTFGPSSHLAIAYAAFSYMDCFAGSDFLCRNHRCIPSQLNCDGFDHCGDNSDEPATCFRDWEMEPQDRKWHANKANYYFPKIDRYPDLKTATLVFVASSLGLIVLISALIILLYRMGARARQQRELQSRLQTISELLDGARIDEISVSDDPPVYEPPPGYDEVVKLALDPDMVGRKKRRGAFTREQRSRTSPSECCSREVGRSSVCSIVETASTSRGNSERASTIALSKSETVRLPESPPPPYVTPPGSTSRNFTASDLPTASNVREPDDDDGERAAAAAEEEEELSRRDWFRRSNERTSLSLSGNGERISETVRQVSVSIDAELFGAYGDASSSTRTADASCDSQRRISLGVSIDAVLPDCEDRGGDEGGTDEAEEQARGTTEPAEEAAEEDVSDRDVANVASDNASGCSCEGACGCATVRPASSLKKERAIGGVRSSAERAEEEERKAEQKTTWEEEGGEQREEEEDSRGSSARSRIARLLGARAGKWQGGSGCSTVASTATSTPCNTLRRSMRKLSVCTRDARFGKTVAVGVGSVGSYEKLSNGELQDTIACSGRRSYRRYASCDLESLYEGMKILDGFLARRGLTMNHGRKQSVTVMLFGTPEHGKTRGRRPVGEEELNGEIVRVSRLSLDSN